MFTLPLRAALPCAVAAALSLISTTALARGDWPERYDDGGNSGYDDEGPGDPDWNSGAAHEPVPYYGERDGDDEYRPGRGSDPFARGPSEAARFAYDARDRDARRYDWRRPGEPLRDIEESSHAPALAAVPHEAASPPGGADLVAPALPPADRAVVAPGVRPTGELPALTSEPTSPAASATSQSPGLAKDAPLETCSDAVRYERDAVAAVESAATSGDGWEVKGRTRDGLNFTCRIDGQGKLALLDLDDLARE